MRLDARTASGLFARSRVAALATVGAGVPHLVPVTFAVRGDTVVIAVDHKPKSSTDLRRLRNIRAEPRVCLLADRYDEDWTRLWWVRADGLAEIAEESAETARLMEKYPPYRERPPRGPFIVVAVVRWTGWSYGPDLDVPSGPGT